MKIKKIKILLFFLGSLFGMSTLCAMDNNKNNDKKSTAFEDIENFESIFFPKKLTDEEMWRQAQKIFELCFEMLDRKVYSGKKLKEFLEGNFEYFAFFIKKFDKKRNAINKIFGCFHLLDYAFEIAQRTGYHKFLTLLLEEGADPRFSRATGKQKFFENMQKLIMCIEKTNNFELLQPVLQYGEKFGKIIINGCSIRSELLKRLKTVVLQKQGNSFYQSQQVILKIKEILKILYPLPRVDKKAFKKYKDINFFFA